LDEERQGLAEQLAEAQEKLREREREEGEEMARLRALLADLERKERERTSAMEELHAEVCSLSNENRLLCRQLEVARREMEVVRTGLEEQVRAEATAAGDLRERMTGLAGVREKWEAEQERVKELQHKLRQAKHDIQFAESVQSKLLHGESTEREMRQLREENAALRGHADNVGLMRYQLQTLREQVERNRDMERKAVRLEEENKLLRERLTSSGDEESTTGSRCTGMQSELTVLRRREMVLVSQVGELESRLKLVQRSADRAESLASETQSQLAREQEECKMRGEKIQRLEKRLLFVSKLRDGCVNVLNSYRLESGVDALLKQNLAEVERQLASANDRIAELEVEVETLSSVKEKL
jgi:chromosome segregation ATPase